MIKMAGPIIKLRAINFDISNIHAIRYMIDDFRTGISHVCDAEWLGNWMQHADFHLIK
jgi:hypothetical protein